MRNCKELRSEVQQYHLKVESLSDTPQLYVGGRDRRLRDQVLLTRGRKQEYHGTKQKALLKATFFSRRSINQHKDVFQLHFEHLCSDKERLGQAWSNHIIAVDKFDTST